MTRDDIRPGDTLRDNDPRGPVRRLLTVTEVCAHTIRARGPDGRVREYQRTAVHVDGKARRTGYTWEPAR